MEKENEENKKEKDLYILKIGTNTLIDDSGHVREGVITEILESVKSILDKGKKVLVVTSGAVRLGRVSLGDLKASKTISASVGQPLLFAFYQKKAKELGITLAEFLLTRPYIVRREQFLNLQNTYNDLFNLGIIPIVNENDALVSGTDWSFGDNDGLACALAVSLKAKKLIIVSHVDGLFDDDPNTNKNAKLIKKVDDLSDHFLKYASRNISDNGSGGMLSKLKVARICSAVGIEMQIISGLIHGNIYKAFLDEEVGTIFTSRVITKKISNRDRWILAAKNSAGSMEVDDGAEKALLEGKSLLLVGVKKVYGYFGKKEIVEILNKSHQGIGFGITDYSSDEIEAIIKSKNIHQKLLMHANNIYKLK